jgi:hypothetical protein
MKLHNRVRENMFEAIDYEFRLRKREGGSVVQRSSFDWGNADKGADIFWLRGEKAIDRDS